MEENGYKRPYENNKNSNNYKKPYKNNYNRDENKFKNNNYSNSDNREAKQFKNRNYSNTNNRDSNQFNKKQNGSSKHNYVKDDSKLHPSWIAKKQMENKLKLKFEGKKLTFDD